MATLIRRDPVVHEAGLFSTARRLTVCQVAESRLRNSSYWALRTLSCEYHDGVLVLNGRLPTYYLKQIAQTLVEGMDGVLEIANRVDVVRRDVRRIANRDDREIASDTGEAV